MSVADQNDPSTAVLLVDAKGVIIRSNKAANALFGSCVGLPCLPTVRPKDNDQHIVCHTACPRGDRSRDSCWNEVHTHNKVATLRCTSMGDVVVVTVDRLADEPNHFQRLTPREREVLGLVAQGLTAGDIAIELGIERSTVRTHVEHCRLKLGARSQAEAVTKAYASHQLKVP